MIRSFNFVIISYNNRMDTMLLHRSLNKFGVNNVIVPTPNQISSNCGLSIKSKYNNLSRVLSIIKAQRLSNNYKVYGEESRFDGTKYIRLN